MFSAHRQNCPQGRGGLFAGKKICLSALFLFGTIAIKQSIGKLQFSMTIPELESLCQERNIKVIGLESSAIELIKMLPTIHGDPFDRLIIAQARMKDMIIVTSDKVMPQYPVKTVW